MSYGFCIPDNPPDHVALAVTLGPSPTDPLYARRVAVLQRCPPFGSPLAGGEGAAPGTNRLRLFLPRAGLGGALARVGVVCAVRVWAAQHYGVTVLHRRQLCAAHDC